MMDHKQQHHPQRSARFRWWSR